MRNHPGCLCLYATVMVSCFIIMWRYHVTVPCDSASCSIAQPLSPYVSHVNFHGVRTKTFSAHVTTQIGPDVRETWLFAHARASLISKIISMCTPVSQCHGYVMPGRDVAGPAPSPRCHRPRANSYLALFPNHTAPIPCPSSTTPPPLLHRARTPRLFPH